MLLGLHNDYVPAQKSRQLNGFFQPVGASGTFEGKDYSAVVMLFLFLKAFLEQAPPCSDEPKIRAIHTLYLDLDEYLMFKSCGVIGSRKSTSNLKENIEKLKAVSKDIFENLKDVNCFIL